MPLEAEESDPLQQPIAKLSQMQIFPHELQGEGELRPWDAIRLECVCFDLLSRSLCRTMTSFVDCVSEGMISWVHVCVEEETEGMEEAEAGVGLTPKR
jgi:hypothetical protein